MGGARTEQAQACAYKGHTGIEQTLRILPSPGLYEAHATERKAHCESEYEGLDTARLSFT